MRPILFELGPLKIYSYGLFVAMAFLVSIFLIERGASRKGLPAAKISNLCLIAFIFSLLGARAMYVLYNLSYYRGEPLEILMLHHGGLMFHGGLIAGVLTIWIYLRMAKLPALAVLDTAALYLPLGQAIGRIGCLLNGCCFGRESAMPWAIVLVSETTLRHPAQLYESIGNIAVFMSLRLAERRFAAAPDGIISSLYLILYSINRIIVEEFRADLPAIWMGFSLTQLLSMLIFIVGIAMAGRLLYASRR